MSQQLIGKPDAAEYAPYYAGYVNLVPDDDILSVLERSRNEGLELLRRIDDAQGNYRYQPSKWSVKELVGHVIDAERAFAFRAFHFARAHQTSLPGFDQDAVALVAPFGALTMREITNEYDSVRLSTLHLFRHLDAASWARRGVANNNEISVRALSYVIAGHERHHWGILKTRYLQ